MTFKNFIVTGTGRSGTKYAAHLFTSMDIPCSHQKVFTSEGNQGWEETRGDSSGFAAPFLEGITNKVLVIHQVRNPWRVARSLVEAGHVPGQKSLKGSQFYAEHTEGLDRIKDVYIRAAHLWWQWNVMIEQAMLDRPNYLFHRVEDYSVEYLKTVFSMLDEEFTDEHHRAFKKLDRTVGTIHPKLPMPKLEDMPHGFWGMVNRYGYERPAR